MSMSLETGRCSHPAVWRAPTFSEAPLVKRAGAVLTWTRLKDPQDEVQSKKQTVRENWRKSRGFADFPERAAAEIRRL